MPGGPEVHLPQFCLESTLIPGIQMCYIPAPKMASHHPHGWWIKNKTSCLQGLWCDWCIEIFGNVQGFWTPPVCPESLCLATVVICSLMCQWCEIANGVKQMANTVSVHRLTSFYTVSRGPRCHGPMSKPGLKRAADSLDTGMEWWSQLWRQRP